MRDHESWCASRYRQGNEPPSACDCGAEREGAQTLSTFSPIKRSKKSKTRWAGRLPAQFCVQCEGSQVKRVTVVPKDEKEPTRVFAACMNAACAWIRELEQPA